VSRKKASQRLDNFGGLVLILILLFSPVWIPEVLLPWWRSWGGFSGPLGLPVIVLLVLLGLGATWFVVGWAVKKGLQAADKN
jgi:uncharacterized SAM-binding protein YcdF (DUF218 family)